MISGNDRVSGNGWWPRGLGTWWWKSRCLGGVSRRLGEFLQAPAGRSTPRPSRFASVGSFMKAVAWVVLLSSVFSSNKALAVSGNARAIRVGHGLRMAVQSEWFNNGGYRPLQIQLTPTKTLVTDRPLDLEVLVQSWPGQPLLFQQSVTIPRGNSPIEVTLRVPQLSPWTNFVLLVYEDGEELPALTLQNSAGFQSSSAEWHEHLPRILVVQSGGSVGRQQEALKALQAVNAGLSSSAMTLTDLQQMDAFHPSSVFWGDENILELPSAELPENWVDFSCVDLVVVDLQDAVSLQTQHPKKWQALRRWTATGGNLLVFGLRQDNSQPSPDPWGQLPVLNSLLNLPITSHGTPRDPKRLGWNKPDLEVLFLARHRGEIVGPVFGPPSSQINLDWENFEKEAARYGLQTGQLGLQPPLNPSPRDPFNFGQPGSSFPPQNRLPGDLVPEDALSGDGQAGNRQAGNPQGRFGQASGGHAPVNMSQWQGYHPPNCRLHFVWRPLQMGRVVAISEHSTAGKLQESTLHDWYWINNTALRNRSRWVDRHGFSLVRGNEGFISFLLPGVGQAPVTSFRVLISLFVILIGPLNYLWLRRLGRVHLMIITVPLGSLAVTVGLFAYALLADGLGTRVRARSVTFLNQQQGEASQWARLSYYAGLRPVAGLAFSERTAVLPLPYAPDQEGSDGPRRIIEYVTRDATSRDAASRDQATGDRATGDRATGDDSALPQKFKQGWLAARRPMQLLTFKNKTTQARLEVNQQQNANGKLSVRVTNRLGSRIQQLLLRDQAGGLYTWQSLDQGDQATLTPVPQGSGPGGIDRGQLNLKWQELFVQAKLRPPEELNGRKSSLFGRRQRPFYSVQIGSQGPSLQVNQHTSLLEENLKRGWFALGADQGLQPGQYVAVVDRPPELELGDPSLQQEHSFHVLFGSW